MTGLNKNTFLLNIIFCGLFILFTSNQGYSFQSPPENDLFHSIKLRNLNISVSDVFDPDEDVYKYRFARIANKIHLNTKNYVVERELLFLSDSLITPLRLSESANNLRNLGIFQKVHFDLDTLNSEYADLNVSVKDYFSSDIGVAFSLEAGEIRGGITLKDFNLLGRGYKFRLGVSNRGDRKFGKLSFTNPRFFSTRFGNKVEIIKFKDGESRFFSLNRHYYTQEMKWDMGGDFQSYKGKIYEYTSGDTYLKRDWELKQVQTFYGKYFGDGMLFRTGIKYFHQDEIGNYGNSSSAEPDWKSRRISFTFGGINRDIYVKQNVDYIDIDEDIHTGFLFNTGIGLDLEGLDSNRKRYVLGFRTLLSEQISNKGHFYLEFGYGTFRDHRVNYANKINARITFFSKLIEKHTICIKGEFNYLDSHREFDQFYLGTNSGLRGLDKRELIGTRRLFFNIEDRIFSNIYFWFIQLGANIFVDTGTMWDTRMDFNNSGWRTSAGLGLRFGIPKLTSGIIRVDLAYNFESRNVSVPSISNGSYFRVVYPMQIGLKNFANLISY
ncbi:BamA/TamA family outer membrane protein [candidate division KSB1 bacterium]